MAEGKSDLELACEVFWGTYHDPADCDLVCTSNPEQCLMLKEALSNLSYEAKMVTVALLNLPEEMFTKTGKVIRKELIHYMKITFGWSAQKTMIVQAEVAELANLFH
jgi:hypothetical protein